MNDHDTPREFRGLGLEPEELDGHTIEELADYLDAGRTPPNPVIETSAGCRLALDAMERLRRLTPELLAVDAAEEPEVPEEWVQDILAGIALDARAGRRIPIPVPSPRADLGITEGAVRGLIRASENAIPGILIGRCHLDGAVTEQGAPIGIRVDVSVPYGAPIPDLADRLRHEIVAQLNAHLQLNLTAVDITVRDIQYSPSHAEEDQ